MHIGVIFPRGGNMVFGKSDGERHAQYALVKLDRFLRILAAIGDMVNTVYLGSSGHCAGSLTSSTPRATWSRSMLSNNALKLPSPKPSSPLRWINSKNT